MYNLQNYKEVTCNPNSKKCLVCFSSNGLWPLEEDRYEFQNITNDKDIKSFYGKIIYIRDVKKHFYIEGINKEINSLELVLALIKKLTKSYETTVIGNSSGGFMAILSACILDNIEYCFSFSGVLFPLEWNGPNFDYSVSDYECLKKATQQTFEYLQVLNNPIRTKCKFFHFYSYKNYADKKQIAGLPNNNKNFKSIKVNTKFHGSTIWSYDLKYLLINPNKYFNKLKSAVYSKFNLSLLIQGLPEFFDNCLKYVRKIKKHSNKLFLDI